MKRIVLWSCVVGIVVMGSACVEDGVKPRSSAARCVTDADCVGGGRCDEVSGACEGGGEVNNGGVGTPNAAPGNNGAGNNGAMPNNSSSNNGGDTNNAPSNNAEVCVPSGVEVCDGVDNDCDDRVDSADAGLELSGCAAVPGAAAVSCAQGACVYGCGAGRVDVNGDLEQGAEGDGCECARGVEVCDGVDNDCDGVVDDSPALRGRGCPEVTGAEATVCADGACGGWRCVGLAVDVNGDLEQGAGGDGCECAPTEGALELCDGVDNDCDGVIDGDDPDYIEAGCARVASARAEACEGGACVWGCEEGFVDVNGDLSSGDSGDGCECPITGGEVCDGIDNDCDGVVDGEVELGACAAVVGADPIGCAAGVCVWECLGNTVDVDGDLGLGPAGSGCECLFTGREYCDGIDNDCDGIVDDDPDLSSEGCPEVTGAEATACVGGVCGGWRCVAPAVDVDGDLELGPAGSGCECTPTSPPTEVCDGVDNDCDGAVDDADLDFVAPRCAVQEGVCAETTAACVAGAAVACDEDRYAAQIEARGDRFVGLEGFELWCGDEDENCDGAVDEVCCPVGGVRSIEPRSSTFYQLSPSLGVSEEGDRIVVGWEEKVAAGVNLSDRSDLMVAGFDVPLGGERFRRWDSGATDQPRQYPRYTATASGWIQTHVFQAALVPEATLRASWYGPELSGPVMTAQVELGDDLNAVRGYAAELWGEREDRILVAWPELGACGFNDYCVRMVMLGQDGTVTPVATIGTNLVSGQARYVDMAHGPQDGMLIWVDRVNGSVVAQRLENPTGLPTLTQRWELPGAVDGRPFVVADEAGEGYYISYPYQPASGPTQLLIYHISTVVRAAPRRVATLSNAQPLRCGKMALLRETPEAAGELVVVTTELGAGSTVAYYRIDPATGTVGPRQWVTGSVDVGGIECAYDVAAVPGVGAAIAFYRDETGSDGVARDRLKMIVVNGEDDRLFCAP